MEEKVAIKLVGRWQDKYVYPDKSVEFGQHGEFDWGYNQIQNTCATLLASLLKSEPGYSGVSQIGIGAGDSSWDTTPPTKSYDQDSLTSEFFRKNVANTDIDFLDPDTGDIVTVPTRKIVISTILAPGEAVGTLREFGLFGGDATSSLNSGQMVNWISHSRIDKDSVLEIQRKIRLEFQIQ